MMQWDPGKHISLWARALVSTIKLSRHPTGRGLEYYQLVYTKSMSSHQISDLLPISVHKNLVFVRDKYLILYFEKKFQILLAGTCTLRLKGISKIPLTRRHFVKADNLEIGFPKCSATAVAWRDVGAWCSHHCGRHASWSQPFIFRQPVGNHTTSSAQVFRPSYEDRIQKKYHKLKPSTTYVVLQNFSLASIFAFRGWTSFMDITACGEIHEETSKFWWDHRFQWYSRVCGVETIGIWTSNLAGNDTQPILPPSTCENEKKILLRRKPQISIVSWKKCRA